MKSPLREMKASVFEARMILLEVKNVLDEYSEPDWGLIRWIANAKIDMKNVVNLLDDIETALARTAYFEEKETNK